jgi:hypothetical protein
LSSRPEFRRAWCGLDPAIKAFVMSAYTQDAVIQNYAEHDFVAALQKPIDVNAFQGVRSRITRS